MKEKKLSEKIEDRMIDRGYERDYDRNIWTDPNAFFGHLNNHVFIRRVPDDYSTNYVVQISTDGSAEFEESEINITVYFGNLGTAWLTVPYHSYKNTNPDEFIDSIETFAKCQYEERKNKMKL